MSSTPPDRAADAFERHLREAIALNRARAPLYAAASGGATRPISRALLAAERLLLPVARCFDRRCAPYHRAGLPLLDQILEPMDRTPGFAVGESHGCAPPAQRPHAGRMRRRVAAAWRADGMAGAAGALHDQLVVLDREPCYHCLLRHLLESALRVTALAPWQVERARLLGLPDPTRISRDLLRLHLWGLGAAARLDRMAAPLQARGVPILCRDVPPVPRPGLDSAPAPAHLG